jgi:hypothetical protein
MDHFRDLVVVSLPKSVAAGHTNSRLQSASSRSPARGSGAGPSYVLRDNRQRTRDQQRPLRKGGERSTLVNALWPRPAGRGMRRRIRAIQLRRRSPAAPLRARGPRPRHQARTPTLRVLPSSRLPRRTPATPLRLQSPAAPLRALQPRPRHRARTRTLRGLPSSPTRRRTPATRPRPQCLARLRGQPRRRKIPRSKVATMTTRTQAARAKNRLGRYL